MENGFVKKLYAKNSFKDFLIKEWIKFKLITQSFWVNIFIARSGNKIWIIVQAKC